jgi:hypothetical protein
LPFKKGAVTLIKKNDIHLLIILYFLVSAPSILSMDTSKHDIVVDLMGFMVQINNTQAVRKIGITTLGRAALGSLLGNGLRLTEFTPAFFETVGRIQHEKRPFEVSWQGHKAPSLLYDFLTSNTLSKDILATVTNGIAKEETHNKAIMHRLAELTFDPVENTNIMQPISGARLLLEDLNRAKQMIHIVANWHGEAFDYLADGPLAAELALVKGQRIISGKTGMVKSHDLYRQFLEVHKPTNPIFVETDQWHVQVLHEISDDIIAILHQGDFKETRRQLIEYNALKED